MEPLYNNLRSTIKSDLLLRWDAYIAEHEILESVTEGIQEMDFSDDVA